MADLESRPRLNSEAVVVNHWLLVVIAEARVVFCQRPTINDSFPREESMEIVRDNPQEISGNAGARGLRRHIRFLFAF